MAVFMIISICGYGILDAAGAFDGIKESLGGNMIVLEDMEDSHVKQE